MVQEETQGIGLQGRRWERQPWPAFVWRLEESGEAGRRQVWGAEGDRVGKWAAVLYQPDSLYFFL